MGCFSDAKWKREKIQDHKFDYVDVDEFVDESCSMQFKYSWVFIITFKTILTYMAEVGVVVLLILTYTNTANLIEQKEVAGGQLSRIPIEVRIGFITGSVVFSYVLLAIEWRKSQLIVQSRDISYAFTSTVAYRYYAIRSYAHFCFFQQIRSSRKTKDVLSFWVYFRLKGWKRLLLAEGPRQFFNIITLYDILVQRGALMKPPVSGFLGLVSAFPTIVSNPANRDVVALIALSTVTITLWLISFITLIIATFLYIYLLFSIRGNLKEYCVHKFDKRIDELLKRKSRKRIREARKAELEELERHQAMDPQGEIRALPPMGLSQGPRLPNVYVEPEEEYYMYGSDFDAVSETGSGAMYYSNPHYSVYSNGMPAQTYPPLPPSTVGGPGSSSRGGGGGYGSSERQAQGTQASPGMLYELDDYYAPSVVSSSNDRSGRSRTPQLQQPYTSGPAIPSTAAYLNNNGPSQSLNLYYTPQQQQGPQGYAPYAGGSNVRLAAESGQLYTNSDGSNGNRRLSPKYDATSGLYKSNM